MEIVDAQVHLPRIVVDWQEGHPRITDADAPVWTPPRQPIFEAASWDTILTAALTAMDAAGIDALLIDEWLGHDAKGRHVPGKEIDGGYRYTFDFSTYVCDRYPERFSFLTRVHWDDPDLENVVATLAATPGMRCLRVTSNAWPPELDAFKAGKFSRTFDAALRNGLPVFIWSNGRFLPNLEQYLRRYPDLQFIADHLGLDHLGTTRVGSANPDEAPGEKEALFEQVLDYGRRFENFAVKWSTVETHSAEPYPYRDMFPYLLRALEVFGRERILWASDWSQHRLQQSWAQSYSWLLDSNELSPSDKEWILGRSSRTVLDWPAVGTTVGEGLYFDCAHAHASMRISGRDEDEFVANMRAHLERWHPQPTMHGTREQLLARARR